MTKCAQLGYNVVNMVKAAKRRVFRPEPDRESPQAEKGYGRKRKNMVLELGFRLIREPRVRPVTGGLRRLLS